MDLVRFILIRAFTLIAFIALSARAELSMLDRSAIRALDGTVDSSISQCREHAGIIWKLGSKFVASRPARGSNDSSGYACYCDASMLAAMYHTHGCTELFYMNESFSETDTSGVDIDQYMETPKRRILKFTVVDRMVYELDRDDGSWHCISRRRR